MLLSTKKWGILMSDLAEEARHIRSVIARIYKGMKYCERQEQGEADRGGVTFAQGSVLHLVFHHPGMSLKEMSQRMGFAHSTLSGIVDRLESKSLIERRIDPSDKRYTRLYVTPAVEHYFKHERTSKLDAYLMKYISKATPEELEQIRSGLAILDRIISSEAEGTPY